MSLEQALEDALPFLVVGDVAPIIPFVGPDWCVSYRHQHGGYACLQSTLHGAFVPLSRFAPAQPLLPVLEALACDSEFGAPIRAHREFASLHLTFGERYSTQQLGCLQRLLDAAASPLPRAVGGTEALVMLENSFELLRGAPVFSTESDNLRLSDGLLVELRRFFPVPKLFLCWFNSD